MSVDRALVDEIRTALAASGDPVRAAGQQRYMKSALPYRGITAPELRALLRPLLAGRRIEDRTAWRDTARALFDEATHREEWYAAVALLRHRYYRPWRDPGLMPLCRHLVGTAAWWDVVDDVATHLVGDVLAGHREAVTPTIRRWADDDLLWVRRTAVLCQVGRRQEVDVDLLADVLDANLEGSRHGSDFFIRKAVGWALRDRARTDPDWVRAYVAARSDRLSGLSRREACKHLR